MLKPRTYQYFAVESRAVLDPQAPWNTEETASTLAFARKKRDQLAAKNRDPEDPWAWRVVRVVQLIEVVDEPFCPETGQRGKEVDRRGR